jgi:hypothetical protein
LRVIRVPFNGVPEMATSNLLPDEVKVAPAIRAETTNGRDSVQSVGVDAK